MASGCLPDRPSLAHLKGEARALLGRLRDGDPAAMAAMAEHHPQRASTRDSSGLRLADAQLVVARRYGFASWPRLRRYLDTVTRYARRPDTQAVGTGEGHPADELLRLGCLVYGGDDVARHTQARRLLADQPRLGRTNMFTVAAVGDVEAARLLLTGDPSTASRSGGTFDWEPLLYLAYSRIDSPDPAHDPLAVARLLLDHGADPNTGYLWSRGCPFTALTGALGGGEDARNQPPHRQALALARLLLERGADPNDSQAVYNGRFEPRLDQLRLLLEFGLGRGAGLWHDRLAVDIPTPSQLLEDQLMVAAEHDLPEWARLVLDQGAHPDGRGTDHPLREGRTPHEMAVARGNRSVADVLRAAGARVAALDPVDQLLAACMAGDEAGVERLVAGDPALAGRAARRRPDAILVATEQGRAEAVRLLVGLGFDVNAWCRITALHQAAFDGDVAMVDLLLGFGADPTLRDPSFDSTPLGWARHNRRDDVVALLAPFETGPPDATSP